MQYTGLSGSHHHWMFPRPNVRIPLGHAYLGVELASTGVTEGNRNEGDAADEARNTRWNFL